MEWIFLDLAVVTFVNLSMSLEENCAFNRLNEKCQFS